VKARPAEASEGLRLCFLADPRSVHTVRWLRYFAERGHRVSLISQHPPPADLPLEAYVPLAEKASLPGTRLALNVMEVRRAVGRLRPDLLHAHYINENGWLGAGSGFHPFVLTAWGSDVYVARQRSRLARWLNPWAVRRADFVTADSLDQIQELRRMGARASEMIGWGVDLGSFPGTLRSDWKRRHGIPGDQPVVLSPRQWLPNSNIADIIEAFERVRRERSDVLLVLKRAPTGPSDLRGQLEDRLRQGGLSGATLVIDELPESEMPGLYEAADVTVSVCSSDGTPVSVLEAMAARSAVIAGDLPSLREWIQPEQTGRLVPVGDPDRLARSILGLLEDGTLRGRLAAGARRLVEERADRHRYFQRMEEICRRLASRGPTP
jgi:glycosyltransferase involved in cell wall biosynthesis